MRDQKSLSFPTFFFSPSCFNFFGCFDFVVLFWVQFNSQQSKKLERDILLKAPKLRLRFIVIPRLHVLSTALQRTERNRRKSPPRSWLEMFEWESWNIKNHIPKLSLKYVELGKTWKSKEKSGEGKKGSSAGRKSMLKATNPSPPPPLDTRLPGEAHSTWALSFFIYLSE